LKKVPEYWCALIPHTYNTVIVELKNLLSGEIKREERERC
jgi:hypothetical protein